MTAIQHRPQNLILVPSTFSPIPAAQAQEPTSPLYFPIKERSVSTAGETIPGWKAITRADTGRVISVVKNSYTVIHNNEVFPEFETLIRESGINTEGMRIEDSVCHNGGRSIRQYFFPRERVEIKGGDNVELRLRAINSYDGSTGFGYTFGGFRLLCSNGMVIGTQIKETLVRHTKNGQDRVLSDLGRVLVAYKQTAQKWEQWADKTITDEDVQRVVEAMPNASKKTRQAILKQYQTETLLLGRTVWALFNALTHWSTHASFNQNTVAEGNQTAIIVQREKAVALALRTDAFRCIA